MQDVKLLGIENYKTSQNNIFLQQIDEAIKVTYSKREMLVVSKNTSKVYQEIGLKYLPITMTQKHLYFLLLQVSF